MDEARKAMAELAAMFPNQPRDSFNPDLRGQELVEAWRTAKLAMLGASDDKRDAASRLAWREAELTTAAADGKNAEQRKAHLELALRDDQQHQAIADEYQSADTAVQEQAIDAAAYEYLIKYELAAMRQNSGVAPNDIPF